VTRIDYIYFKLNGDTIEYLPNHQKNYARVC